MKMGLPPVMLVLHGILLVPIWGGNGLPSVTPLEVLPV